MALRIIQPGIRSLIQDRGRWGQHKIGLGISGALDEDSYLQGHFLLKNNLTSNSIEIFMGNFQAVAEKRSNFAITGADALILKNEKEIPINSSFPLEKGDKISIQEMRKGSLNYLTVENGFSLLKWNKSYATNFSLQIGANAGRILSKQILPFNEAKLKIPKLLKTRNLLAYLNQKEPYPIRIVFYPKERSFFSEQTKKKILNSIYSIGLSSDRMGIRLEGEKINADKINILSQGISLGTVQVPLSGEPIILMKDYQTIGGYNQLGYIPALDCFRLAQLRARQKIYFIEEKAENSRLEFKNFYKNFLP